MADPLGIAAPIGSIATIEPHAAPSIGQSPSSTEDHGSARGAERAPPTELAIGTLVEAVVLDPPAGSTGLAAGTQLLLRIVAPNDTSRGDLLTGTVGDSAGTETFIASPIGLLALHRRLALPVGTPIAFTLVNTTSPAHAAATFEMPEWQSLDDALTALSTTAPRLAEALQAALAPPDGPALAGSMLYLSGAIYQAAWQGGLLSAAMAQLAAAGQQKLARRLRDDLQHLRKRSGDPASGDWDIFALPLRRGRRIVPVYLYLSRRRAGPNEAKHFVLEIELDHFGPVQLDVLARGDRLILVLRSHHALPAALRSGLEAAFNTVLLATGITGAFSIAVGSQFPIDPLAPTRQHVQLTI